MARVVLTLTRCASFIIVFIHGYSGIPLQYEECEIGDSLISGSNVTYPDYDKGDQYNPAMSRLEDPAAVWLAFVTNTTQFLVVDLGSEHIITRVSTQGRPGEDEYVTDYTLEYSTDNKAWMQYKNKFGLTLLFKGNNDSENAVENTLAYPIIARYIKFNVILYHRAISMRIDVVGCPYVPESIQSSNDGHIVYEVSDPEPTNADVISLRFRTTRENGIIFYIRRDGEFNDVMLLELRQGELHLKIDLIMPESLSGLTEVAGGRYLNDGLWHDVIFTRNGSMAKLTVDQYEIDFQIKHRFIIFKPSAKLFIFGVDNLYSKGLSHSKQFNGCIDRFRYNDNNITRNVRDLMPGYFISGPVAFKCSLVVDDCFSLVENTSRLLYHVPEEPDIRVGFDFKTVDKNAIIFRYSESNGYGVELGLDEKGYLLYSITREDRLIFIDTIQKVDIDGNSGVYTDGLWHTFYIHMNTTKFLNINVTVDGYSRLTTKYIYFGIIGGEFQFGYSSLSQPGFIGCLRNITFDTVSGESLNLQKSDLVRIGPCTIKDKCTPNLCEHGGKCRQDADTFFCDCSNTGYTGALCHISPHPSSCAVYSMNLNPRMSHKDVTIDPDGSGPLDPFLVDCYSADSKNVQTSVSHDVMKPVTVDGYQEPNYYTRKIRYSTALDGLSELIERSDTCRQMIIWRCNNSRLMFRTMDFDLKTYGYWVGRTNHNMFYWGGSAPETYRCECGVSERESCISGMQTCNCDSGENTSDGGYLTQKQYLPVMELHFGDTGTLTDNKVGQYELGKLECYGDSLLDNTVTFQKKDATLEFPPFKIGKAGDIWFQFKTTATEGVLIHNTGDTNDTFIKIELKYGYLDLTYNADNRIQRLSNRRNLSDDTWHSVIVEFNIKQAYLRVDNFQASIDDEPRDHSPRHFELTKPLTVGATVDYNNGFVGCMRGLRVNGVLMDMTGAVRSGQFTYGVQEGCVGKCSSTPCFNGGMCTEGYSNYTCDCTKTPYVGRFCSKEVGVEMRMNYMLEYNFENIYNPMYRAPSVININVGFKTKKKQGILLFLRGENNEHVSLEINNNGGVKFFMDAGYVRWEINTDFFGIDHTDDQPHMVTLRRDLQRISLQVDNYPPSIGMLDRLLINSNIFKSLNWLYIGNNSTLSTWKGFEGCIYNVQIDGMFPLKKALEDPHLFIFDPNENEKPPGQLINETTCGFEEVTRAPEPEEVRVVPIDEWVPSPTCGTSVPPPTDDVGGKHIDEGELFFTFPRQDIVLNENSTGLLTMMCRVTSPSTLVHDLNYILIRQETSPKSSEFECLAMIESKEMQTPMLYDQLNTNKTYVLNGTFNRTLATYPYLSVGMDVLNLTCDDAKKYMCEVGYKNSYTGAFETVSTVSTILAGAGCEVPEKLMDDNSDDSLDTKSKVGIAIGVVGGIILVIVIIIVVCKYRRAGGRRNDDQDTMGYSASYTRTSE